MLASRTYKPLIQSSIAH